MVTVIVALLAEPIVDGVALPLSTVPVLELSSLKLIVCPLAKLAMLPSSVVGSAVTVVEELKLRDGEATVKVALWALSAPRQLLCAGVTVYCQLPAGTSDSVQVRAETVPEQAEPIVCPLPLVS